MKKNKIYSASDFRSASVSVVVDGCFWVIDRVDYTKEGSYSGTPLFELELKQLIMPDDSGDGYVDASAEMQPNRTYFVREGRPLYNKLLSMWRIADGDKEDFVSYVMKEYANKKFRGRVECVTGISYTKPTKSGGSITKSRMEAWYPESYDEGRVLDDFLYLCNIGVYKPIVEENTDDDDPAKMLAGVDTAKLKALLAALKK